MGGPSTGQGSRPPRLGATSAARWTLKGNTAKWKGLKP